MQGVNVAQSPARWMPTRILVDRTLWFDPFGKNGRMDWAPPAWILNLIYPSLGWAAGGPAGYPSPPQEGASVFNGLRTQAAVSRLVGDIQTIANKRLSRERLCFCTAL
jgi:hypothetical protein